MKDFTTALLITTYNSPDYLSLVLKSVARQSCMPDEILIADDGSGKPTKELIDQFRKEIAVPVKHAWQPDEGFRAGAARNKAIAMTDADYIIMIDGDMVLDKNFVYDHKKFAREGSFIVGSRTLLDEKTTKEVLLDGDISKLKHIRLPFLTPFFRQLRSKDGIRARTCNMAVWRKDFLAINGFNEDINGWGCEDSELSIRLMNYGLQKNWLKFGAVQFHLYHKENDHSQHERNKEFMYNAIKKRITRIPNGITKDPKK